MPHNHSVRIGWRMRLWVQRPIGCVCNLPIKKKKRKEKKRVSFTVILALFNCYGKFSLQHNTRSINRISHNINVFIHSSAVLFHSRKSTKLVCIHLVRQGNHHVIFSLFIPTSSIFCYLIFKTKDTVFITHFQQNTYIFTCH
jgi:hypothetical protein